MYLSINTREERAEKKEGGLEGPKEKKKTEKEKQGRFTEKKTEGELFWELRGTIITEEEMKERKRNK